VNRSTNKFTYTKGFFEYKKISDSRYIIPSLIVFLKFATLFGFFNLLTMYPLRVSIPSLLFSARISVSDLLGIIFLILVVNYNRWSSRRLYIFFFRMTILIKLLKVAGVYLG